MLKVNNQPYKKKLGLVFSWVNIFKNCKILTFKVNFLRQKISESFQFFFSLKSINLGAQCLHVSITPIIAMGCRQCLPLSVVQLKGKHCRKPHCRNGVVDTFGHFLLLTFFDNFNFLSTLFSKMEVVFWQNLHKCTQDLKNFIRQVIVLEHKWRPCKMCDSVRQKLGHTRKRALW